MVQMSAAQQAQQNNRHTDGRYAEGVMADPGIGVLGEEFDGSRDDLALWRDVHIPTPGPGQDYVDHTPVHADDFDAAYRNFMRPLTEWETQHRADYEPQLTQEQLCRLAGFDERRLHDITASHRFEAAAAGILVHYPNVAEPSLLQPVEPGRYLAMQQLDLRAGLRDGIRNGTVPPWAILTGSPDAHERFFTEEAELEGQRRTAVKDATEWRQAVTEGQAVLNEASVQPATDVTQTWWTRPENLTARTVATAADDYRREERYRAEARQKKAAASRDLSDFMNALNENPNLPPIVVEAVAKGKKGAEHDLRRAESDERSAHRKMREQVAILTRTMPRAIEQQDAARDAVSVVENKLAELEQRKAWELSWPGLAASCPPPRQ